MESAANKRTSIYIAGHRGLIGSAMVRRLSGDRHVDLLLPDPSELDLTDAVAVNAFFEKYRPEYVILAAGRTGGIAANQSRPADFLNINLAIQLNVFQSALRTNVRRLLFFGSSCMYPRECPQPMPETLLLSGRPEPTSLAYAVAKLAGTQMCLAYNRQYGGTRFIPLIPNSVYGPNDNFDLKSGHVLASLLRRFHLAKQNDAAEVTLWGSGTPRREFIYGDDVADACLVLMFCDLTETDLPINVGVGKDYSIRELAETIAGVTGFRGRIEWDRCHPDGAPQKLLDNRRILRLGWTPKIDLVTGIRQTYRWYLDNPPVSGE